MNTPSVNNVRPMLWPPGMRMRASSTRTSTVLSGIHPRRENSTRALPGSSVVSVVTREPSVSSVEESTHVLSSATSAFMGRKKEYDFSSPGVK